MFDNLEVMPWFEENGSKLDCSVIADINRVSGNICPLDSIHFRDFW
jgi:hypothetical protein